MADIKSWVLTDAEKRIWEESFTISGEELGLGEGWSIRKSTLRGGLSDGVEIIEVDNGALSFTVLPTRGMSIWKGNYKELPIGWNSPVRGPVHPKFVDLQERGGLGFLTGFDEAIARCGLDSTGAPCTDVVLNNMGEPAEVELTLHGKVGNLPASRIEIQVIADDTSDGETPELVVIGELYETGLFCPAYKLVSKLSTKIGSNRMEIIDEVTNLRGVGAEMELLYHCNFGAPFLDEGAKLVTAASVVAPRDARAVEGLGGYDTYLGPTPGYVEQVYWYDLLAKEDGATLAMLRNGDGDKGLVLRFNKNQLPTFTQWKNTASESDGYVTGLEPATDYPNAKPFERSRGRVVAMEPGETYRMELAMEICDSATAVEAVKEEIAALQSQKERLVHDEPITEFSAVDPDEALMEHFVKITSLETEVQAQVLEGVLKEREIPYLLQSHRDSSYDGLFQSRTLWGHLEAPEEFKEEILGIFEDLEKEEEE